MRLRSYLAAVAVLFVACTDHREPGVTEPGVTSIETPAPTKRVVAYFTNDMPSCTAAAIEYRKLTHVCHAFLQPNSDGSITIPSGYLNGELIRLAHAAGVKVLCTIGGPIGNNNQIFKEISASQAACDRMALDFESICRTYGYDGIDMNWEFPESAEERTGNNRMVKTIHDRFKASPAPAPSWEICLAVPAGEWYARWYDYDTLNNYVDYYNVMLFPYHGAWSTYAGHNSPLYAGSDPDGASCDVSIRYMLDTRRVPASKINFGLPFSGMLFTRVETLLDDCGGKCAVSDVLYRDVPAMLVSGWAEKWDAGSQVPYAEYGGGPGLLTYDNGQSISVKVRYALEAKDLGGVFFWKLGLDEVSGQSVLLDAIDDARQ